MLEWTIRSAIAHRWLVLLLTLAIAGLGAWNFTRLPIDAVPDITNVQVQINTEAPGYSPLEAEQRVTYPVETALAVCLAWSIPARSRVTACPRSRSCSKTARTSISPDNWSTNACRVSVRNCPWV